MKIVDVGITNNCNIWVVDNMNENKNINLSCDKFNKIMLNNQVMIDSNTIKKKINNFTVVKKNNNMMNTNNKNHQMIFQSKQNINIQTINSIPNLENDFKINLIFDNPRTKYTNIICKLSEKVSDIIKRYRYKSGDNDYNQFLFNGRSLNPNQKLSSVGVTDGFRILVCMR